jgi:hypothetical protein
MAAKKKTSTEQTPGPCVAYLRNGRICGNPATDFARPSAGCRSTAKLVHCWR